MKIYAYIMVLFATYATTECMERQNTITVIPNELYVSGVMPNLIETPRYLSSLFVTCKTMYALSTDINFYKAVQENGKEVSGQQLLRIMKVCAQKDDIRGIKYIMQTLNQDQKEDVIVLTELLNNDGSDVSSIMNVFKSIHLARPCNMIDHQTVRASFFDDLKDVIMFDISIIFSSHFFRTYLINARNEDKRTALHVATRKENQELITFLCSLGADVDAEDKVHFTPLNIAVRWNYCELLKLLSLHGAQINGVDKCHTPLHFATRWGKHTVIQTLYDCGADINIQDERGYTPLHIAVLWNDLLTVKQLYSLGAQLHIRNNEGRMPIDTAIAKGYQEITDYLNSIQ